MQHFTNWRIIRYGLVSAVFYWAITLILMKLFDNVIIFFSFYFPGVIFGFFLTVALTEYKKADPATLTIASILIYGLVLLLMNKNITVFIQTRQILSPGIGGLLLLTVISKTYSIDIKFKDYLLTFLLGVFTTFYSWTEIKEFYNPWSLFLAIGLWQVTFAIHLSYIADRKFKIKD